MGANQSIDSFNYYGQVHVANNNAVNKQKCISRCTSSRNNKLNRPNLRKNLSNSFKMAKNHNKCVVKCSTSKNTINKNQYYASTVGSTITANHAINKSDNQTFNDYSDSKENLTLNKQGSTSSGGSSGSGDEIKKPVKVVVTGGCGNIAQSMAFRIASGQLLGPNQPVHLTLLDIPAMVSRMKGLEMELTDCAFNTLSGITYTANLKEAFKNSNINFMVGAFPRKQGMERGDLLKINGKIFGPQAEAIDKYADIDCKTVVVGNPANTNALIMSHKFNRVDKRNVTAMTRLDHNRAVGSLSNILKKPYAAFKKLAIWGNHSPTMYPDLTNTTVNGGSLFTTYGEGKFRSKEFLTDIQQRGAAVIKARQLSSAASAGNAALDHMRDWVKGSNGNWVSMGVLSDGNKQGIPEGLIYSFPCICKDGNYKIVEGLSFDKFSKEKLKITNDELLKERSLIKDLIK